jgi:hypothetical protein
MAKLPEHALLHRAPKAIVPLIIRWGGDASSDVLRACARCFEVRSERSLADVAELGWTRRRLRAVSGRAAVEGAGGL